MKLAAKDAEWIGNFQDRHCSKYVKDLAKAKHAASQAVFIAKKAGKQPSSSGAERILALQQTIYQCRYGGVPMHVHVPDAASSSQLPICRQPVPAVRSEDIGEINAQV